MRQMGQDADDHSHPLSRSDGKPSGHLFSLEKLITVADNLTRMQVGRRMDDQMNTQASDLTFNFVRSLLLDKVVENPILLDAILSNRVCNLAQLESFSKISYTNKFQSIIERLQSIVR
jgi:hypothetical protein